MNVRFPEDIPRACRVVREVAVALGFGRIPVAELEIVASELATNLVKHRTVDGRIAVSPLRRGRHVGLEIVARDEGPGTTGIDRVMRNAASTAGGLGIGLSGVKRLTDDFSISSSLGVGTVVRTVKWLETSEGSRMRFSVQTRPCPGESLSGDEWFIRQNNRFAIFGVIDVLGHGPDANAVAVQLLGLLDANHAEPLDVIVDICHCELSGTRGSALALCKVFFDESRFEHIAIGNVETRIYGTSEPIRPFFHNGTLGMATINRKILSYPYAPGTTFIMFSDGIVGRINLSPRQLAASPQELATDLFDPNCRNTDDATLLVGR
jgi:anti-sigma regulatory factor (Ser/Thr protein kinase)